MILKSEWKGVTHISVTHGGPDHFDFTAKMTKATKAPVICGKQLKEKGLLKNVENVERIGVGEVIGLKGFQVKGLKIVRGPVNPDIFENEVKKMGLECVIMKYGDEILV